jgi:hypothetical protein
MKLSDSFGKFKIFCLKTFLFVFTQIAVLFFATHGIIDKLFDWNARGPFRGNIGDFCRDPGVEVVFIGIQ